LRDVFGTFGDQLSLGHATSIGRRVVDEVGEMSILREPLADGLLGRAAVETRCRRVL
jgi:hypothetical protein